MKRIFMIIVCVSLFTTLSFSKEINVKSLDGKVEIKLSIDKKIQYSIFYKSYCILKDCVLNVNLRDQGVLGDHPKIKKIVKKTINQKLYPVVPLKSKVVIDHYRSLQIDFKKKFSLIFRVYNQGVAYRFITRINKKIIINSENVILNFAKDYKAYFGKVKGFITHQETNYIKQSISMIPQKDMGILPILVELEDGAKMAVMEADLYDYPGLSVKKIDPLSIQGVFPKFILKERKVRDRKIIADVRANYIADTSGNRSFPWRIFSFSEKDSDLLLNQMVFQLSKECKIKDPQWIKPGKVAWDWWNALNLYGVDFKSGINTRTYKYYIDFASKFGLEYIILDEGWSDTEDLFKVNQDINLNELVLYGKKKNVGIILWVVWKTLDDQLEKSLMYFEKLGIKGIKVDFMQRDDQWMVNYYERIARKAAEHHLLVDFHGSYKPSGLRRAYPNVLTREGVQGLEHSKWSKHPTPEDNLTIPFTRMLAGPIDYTPGAMLNANEKNFIPRFSRPMSLGTRCHQLAMYIIFESPLQMLADSPVHYQEEQECTGFISKIPVVWDETIVQEAKVGDYIVMVRRKGDRWYVGSMTDWTARDFDLDLSFLGEGDHQIEIFQDGINAQKNAEDYKRIIKTVNSKDKIKIHLAPGGGFAALIKNTH